MENNRIEIDTITLAYLQMHNTTLACNFSDLHKAVENVLGRGVFTHQFASKEALLSMNMYNKNGLPHENLCREDILEVIDQKFNDYCLQKITGGGRRK